MIIVEGPDGGGKSNLAGYLSKRFGIPIADKVVNSRTEAQTPLDKWVSLSLEKGLQRTIFDRHAIISEPIYAAAMRYVAKDGFNRVGWLSGQMAKLDKIGPFIVYCLPPIKTVEANVFNAETDNDVVVEKIQTIWGMYAAQAAREVSLGRAMIHDYTVDGSEQRIEMILSHWLAARGILQ